MAICPNCQRKGEELYALCPCGDGSYFVEETEFQSHPSDPWLGRRIGERFVVASILGQGSMGHVYKAYQQQVDRMVAVKIFETKKVESLNHIGEDPMGPGGRERFVQEAKVLAKLSHPNCVTLYDFGWDKEERFLYIAMEHVGGISLRRAVRRGVKIEAIIEIIRQVLKALREAHALGIVHRDLKPENIILSYRRTSDEQIVKVLDFGIAKLLQSDATAHTAVGLLFGTPAYMSPEQCRGETDVTAASDIYALGCMIFEMVTGHLPFEAERPQEMVRLHQEAPVPTMVPQGRMKLPQGFEVFVAKCMAKDWRDRYQNAGTALAAFEAVVGGEAQSGSLARGMARLGEEGGAKRVSVPKNRVSGAELDPTGERRRLEGEEKAPRKKRAGGVENATVQARDEPDRVTDTMRGSKNASQLSSRRGEKRASGRTGLVVMAVLVVLIFCALLFAAIYIQLKS